MRRKTEITIEAAQHALTEAARGLAMDLIRAGEMHGETRVYLDDEFNQAVTLKFILKPDMTWEWA